MAQHLQPISDALPEQLFHALGPSSPRGKLLIIPAGWLWGVPFAALPLPSGGVLVDHADLAYTPSLRVHAAAGTSNDSAHGHGAVSFTLPRLAGTPDLDALDEFPGGHTRRGIGELHDAILATENRWQLTVIAAHGNREPGLAQAVLTDDGKAALTAATLLTSDRTPPERLSMAICHGLYPPNDDPHEPLGLAICALATGTREIISTHFEVDFGGNESIASSVLARTYGLIASGCDAPSALNQAQRETPCRASQPLARWAVLASLTSGH